MRSFYKVFTIVFLTAICYSANAQVAINNDNSPADDSAILDVKSTTKGFLPPRMTETQRDAISNPEEGLQIFNTTTKRPNYFNGYLWLHFDRTAAQAVSIGDFHAGGVVFWLDGNGGGLVCAVNNQSYNGDYTIPWGCYNTDIDGADEWDIGTGNQNTIDIIAGCTVLDIPARVCSDLTLNGYSDWFLPSREELFEMALNQIIIAATASANGGVGFTSFWYASSTEYDIDEAWALDFTNGNFTEYHKLSSLYFRAIRAF